MDMMVLETIGLGVLGYWAAAGVASGALQLARGTVLAAGALAEGDLQLAGGALARSLAAPGLGVVHEGLALSGDVYTSVLAIGRAAAPLAPCRNGPAFAESRL
jgi:hypothetical protein